MAKVKVRREGNLLWEDECQPLTTEQMTNIKSQFHPSNTANVNIVPYEIYDEDGEERVIGEVRKTIDGVKKSKPLYSRNILLTGTFNGMDLIIYTGDDWHIDEILQFSGTSRINNTITTELGFGHPTSQYSREIYYNVSNHSISVCTSSTPFIDPKIHFEYTKTSDEWQPV